MLKYLIWSNITLVVLTSKKETWDCSMLQLVPCIMNDMVLQFMTNITATAKCIHSQLNRANNEGLQRHLVADGWRRSGNNNAYVISLLLKKQIYLLYT